MTIQFLQNLMWSNLDHLSKMDHLYLWIFLFCESRCSSCCKWFRTSFCQSFYNSQSYSLTSMSYNVTLINHHVTIASSDNLTKSMPRNIIGFLIIEAPMNINATNSWANKQFLDDLPSLESLAGNGMYAYLILSAQFGAVNIEASMELERVISAHRV